MDWWIIAILAIAVVILVSIYRISLRENRDLTHYMLLLVLNDEIYRAARVNLLGRVLIKSSSVRAAR